VCSSGCVNGVLESRRGRLRARSFESSSGLTVGGRRGEADVRGAGYREGLCLSSSESL